MPRRQTLIVTNGIDVDRRLAELGLGTREDVLAVRDIACGKAAEGASPFFPLNGAGTLAYQYGTREWRARLDDHGWKVDDAYGTSGMRHPSDKRLTFYQNVDVACDLAREPRPRTCKGAGAERLDQGVLFEGEDLPTDFDSDQVGCEVWYVMVAEGGAIEVTRAVVRKGGFAELVERLFVDDGGDFSVVGPADGLTDDDAIDFDVAVTRR